MNVQTFRICVLGIIGAAVPLFAETVVEWDQAAQLASYSNGAVKVTYDGAGNVSDLSSDPKAAGGIQFADGAMTLSSAAAVIQTTSGGDVVFNNGWTMTGVGSDSRAQLSFLSPISTETSISVDAPGNGGGWRTLVKNMSLSDIADARFEVKGVKMGHLPFVWAADGQSFSCEFQHWFSLSTLRAFVIEFRQNMNVIEYQFKAYRHLTDSTYQVVTYPDENVTTIYYSAYPETWPQDPKLAYSIQGPTYPGGYEPTGPLEVDFSKTIPADPVTYTLKAGNQLDNVDVKLGQTSADTVIVQHGDALPFSGSVEIGPRGLLTLDYNGSSDVVRGCDHGVPITVREGGVLLYKRVYQLNTDYSQVVLDGGVMRVSATGEPGNYVKNITFRNGGKTTGGALRVRSNNAVWKVEGTSPSSCESGFTAWCGAQNKGAVFTLDVDDVTGDTNVDFTVSGPVTRGTADGWNVIDIAKTGAGTMRLETSYGLDTRPTTIKAGAMEFGDGVIGNACEFVIDGGVLAVSDQSVNACAGLTLAGSGGLVLGTGAQLSFGDCSDKAWASGATLTISGDLSTSRLRFGASKDALTKSQLRKIVFAGDAANSAALDDDGYLCKVPKPGLMLIFR